MGTIGESTTADYDSNQAEQGVHHEQPTGSDWAAADKVEKGLAAYDSEGGSALEAYITFDEASGTLNDVTGNGHDGSTTGDPTYGATGLLGTTCLSFDGVTDGVECGNFGTPGTFDNADWTVVFFAKNDSFSGSPNSNQVMASYRNATVSNRFWQVEHNQFNGFRLSVDDTNGTTRATVGDTFASTDTWYLHAAVHDETSGFTYYVIEPDGTVQSASIGDKGSMEDSRNELRFARNQNTFEEFAGDIDEARVYNRALSQAQIVEIHDAVFGTSEYWADKKTGTGNASSLTLTTTSTLNSGSITVHVYEELGDDGTGANSVTDADGNTINYDNHNSVALSGGAAEENTLTGFDGNGTTNAYYIRVVYGSMTNPTDDAATLDSWEVDLGAAAGESKSQTVTQVVNAVDTVTAPAMFSRAFSAVAACVHAVQRHTGPTFPVETFDDGDLSEYSEIQGSPTDFSVSTTEVHEGSHSLTHDGSAASDETIVRNAGGHLIERGNTYRFHFYIDSATGANARYSIHFAVEDEGDGDSLPNNAYFLRIDGPDDRIFIGRLSDTVGNTTLDNRLVPGGIDVLTQQWSYLDVDYGDTNHDDIVMDVYNGDGDYYGRAEATDTTHRNGGLGFDITAAETSERIYFDTIERVGKAETFSRAFSEVVNVVDAVSASIVAGLTKSQTVDQVVNVVDAVTTKSAFSRALSQTVDVVDAVADTETWSRALSQTVDVVGDVSTAATFPRSLSEVVTVVRDVATGRGRTHTVDQVINVVDAVSTPAAFSRALDAVVNVVDTVADTEAWSRSFDETVAVVTDLTAVKAFTEALSETIAVVDTVADTEAWSRSFDETVELVHAAVAKGTFPRTLSETVAVTTAFSFLQKRVIALAQTVNVVDDVNTIGTFIEALSETVAVVDDLQTKLIATFSAALAETVAVVDDFARVGTFTEALAQTVAVVHAARAKGRFPRSFSETVNVVDAVDTFTSVIKRLEETVAIVDEMVRGPINFSRTMEQTVSVVETIRAGLLATPGEVLTATEEALSEMQKLRKALEARGRRR